MIFEFMRLRVHDLAPAGDWTEVGAMLRGDDGRGVTFHTRRGFEPITAPFVEAAQRATIGGTVADAWDYWLDRGFGLYSVFTEPDRLEADSRDAAAESLLR